MVYCNVNGCKNNSSKKSQIEHIQFHRFPRDINLCKQWILACNKKHTDMKNARICSIHFDENDYIIRDRLMCTPFEKKHLCSIAVPRKFLPKDCIFNEKSIRAKKQDHKKLIENLLKTKRCSFKSSTISKNSFADVKVQTEGEYNWDSLVEIHSLQQDMEEMKETFSKQEQQILQLQEQQEKFETNLCETLSFTPDQLKKLFCKVPNIKLEEDELV